MPTESTTRKPISEWGLWQETKDWVAQVVAYSEAIPQDHSALRTVLVKHSCGVLDHLTAGFFKFGTDNKVHSYDQAQLLCRQTVSLIAVCQELTWFSPDQATTLTTKAEELASGYGRCSGSLIKKQKEKQK